MQQVEADPGGPIVHIEVPPRQGDGQIGDPRQERHRRPVYSHAIRRARRRIPGCVLKGLASGPGAAGVSSLTGPAYGWPRHHRGAPGRFPGHKEPATKR
jgi:hypothetical protein